MVKTQFLFLLKVNIKLGLHYVETPSKPSNFEKESTLIKNLIKFGFWNYYLWIMMIIFFIIKKGTLKFTMALINKDGFYVY